MARDFCRGKADAPATGLSVVGSSVTVGPSDEASTVLSNRVPRVEPCEPRKEKCRGKESTSNVSESVDRSDASVVDGVDSTTPKYPNPSTTTRNIVVRRRARDLVPTPCRK